MIFAGARDHDADHPRPPRIRGGDVAAVLIIATAIGWVLSEVATWALLDEGRLGFLGIGP